MMKRQDKTYDWMRAIHETNNKQIGVSRSQPILVNWTTSAAWLVCIRNGSFPGLRICESRSDSYSCSGLQTHHRRHLDGSSKGSRASSPQRGFDARQHHGLEL